MSLGGRLWLRLLLALVAALAAIAALDQWLQRKEDEARAAEQRRLAAQAAAAPRPVLDLGVSAESVLLCARLEEVPQVSAPVLQLLPDGSLAVRRPAPTAARPGRAAVAEAALVLPVAGLPELTAVQRAVLLEQLAVLVAERPIAPGRVRLLGLRGEPGDLGALLAWVR